MTYSETIDYLYNSQPAFHLVGASAYKPGLQNTIKLMEHLGNPNRKFRSIHVAGTNGKGSTAHMLAAVLHKAGYKVGLYTSPHLVDFRERIRVSKQEILSCITKEQVISFVEQNKAFLDDLKPSFFETTMAMAFQCFADERVDIAVVEVGLGGRLDSTNIILPELSVITNIGLDHTEFLGNTLAQIAAEKAGIIKENTPVVIGEWNEETKPVFTAKANDMHSKLIYAGDLPDNRSLIEHCELRGQYQAKNIRTVEAAVVELREQGWSIADEHLRDGLSNVCTLTGLQGRWQTLQHNPLVICDTGHNSHGIRSYVKQLEQYERLHVVFGMVSDKDIADVLALLPRSATYYFAAAATHRAVPAQNLKLMAAEHGLHGNAFQTVEEAVKQALTNAATNDTIFIGGSNYVVGEALALFNSLPK